MSDQREEARLERVRSILRAMDRSIDAARSKRLNTDLDDDETTETTRAHALAGAKEEHDEDESETTSNEPARVPTSMFDRDGPRLKARPKR